MISTTMSMAGMSGAANLLCLITLYEWISQRQIIQLPKWFWISLFLFPAMALVSALFGQNMEFSLKAMRDLWRWLLPLAMMWCLRDQKLEGLLKCFFACLGVIAVYSVIQHFFGVDWFRAEGFKKITPYRPDGLETGVFHAKGNFSHHLTYAHHLVLAVPVALSLAAFGRRSHTETILLGLIGLVGACALVLTLGRSAWLGLMVSVAVLTLRLPLKWLLGFLLGGLIGLIVILEVWKPSSFDDYGKQLHVSALQARIESAFTLRHHRDRFFLWQAAWLAFEDHPITGTGWGNYDALEPYRQQSAGQEHQFLNKARAGPHNIYLQILYSTGALGMAGFVVFWAGMFRLALKAYFRQKSQSQWKASLVWGILAGWCGFLIGGIFENNLLDGEPQTLLFVWVGIAGLLAFELASKNARSGE